jgi:hypothetical protein
MRPTSARFLATVRGSHRMVARARLCTPGQVGTNPTGVEIPILSGDVQLDATAEVRATLGMTTAWPWPSSSADLFTPYGTEVFVERGVVYGDGTREWVSQGYFRLQKQEQNYAPDGPVALTGSDRMAAIIKAKLLAPFQFDASTPVSVVFSNLVGEVYPGAVIVYDFPAAATLFTTSHIVEESRYEFLRDIAQSLGKVMYWGYDGRLYVVSVPNPTVPVFDVTHGAGGVLTELRRSLSDDGVHNAVVATGEQPGEAPPVRGIAYDLDPTSPTRWGGPFGPAPRFYSSSFLTTDDQCRTAAAAMLAREKGLPYQVDFAAVPNPALEPLDAVRVSYSDAQRAEVHVLDRLAVPLLPDVAMTAATRVTYQGVTT